jgi:integral membrane protein
VSAALTRYRVLAYTVGSLLVILVLIGVPLQVFADSDGVEKVVGTLHGFLFLIYLLSTVDLAVRGRWSPVRIVLVLAAGLVPFLTFVAEHNVTEYTRRHQRV